MQPGRSRSGRPLADHRALRRDRRAGRPDGHAVLQLRPRHASDDVTPPSEAPSSAPAGNISATSWARWLQPTPTSRTASTPTSTPSRPASKANQSAVRRRRRDSSLPGRRKQGERAGRVRSGRDLGRDDPRGCRTCSPVPARGAGRADSPGRDREPRDRPAPGRRRPAHRRADRREGASRSAGTARPGSCQSWPPPRRPRRERLSDRPDLLFGPDWMVRGDSFAHDARCPAVGNRDMSRPAAALGGQDHGRSRVALSAA